jgi:alcohol dehydrogenase class IV
VPYGASHGIGHSLGAVTGISHGYTSCIMLPHVMRYNLPVTKDAQALIAQSLGGANAKADQAADLVAELIATLKMPTKLSDQFVDPGQHEKIAAGAMQNIWVKTNPKPLTSADQIEQMLAQAQ